MLVIGVRLFFICQTNIYIITQGRNIPFVIKSFNVTFSEDTKRVHRTDSVTGLYEECLNR